MMSVRSFECIVSCSHFLIPDSSKIASKLQLGMVWPAITPRRRKWKRQRHGRQTIVHELVQEFSMPLLSLGFNNRRDATFRWIAQSHHQAHDHDDGATDYMA